MKRTMLSGKIHRARVTQANVDYAGSITIDVDLLEAAGILPFELVHVLDVDNGERIETYAMAGERASGDVIINGAAARRVHQGDTIIILSYVVVSEEEARSLVPRIVLVGGDNRVLEPQASNRADRS